MRSLGHPETPICEDIIFFELHVEIVIWFSIMQDKEKPKGKEIRWPELKPCIYKRR